jgi:hypothetical protein
MNWYKICSKNSKASCSLQVRRSGVLAPLCSFRIPCTGGFWRPCVVSGVLLLRPAMGLACPIFSPSFSLSLFHVARRCQWQLAPGCAAARSHPHRAHMRERRVRGKQAPDPVFTLVSLLHPAARCGCDAAAVLILIRFAACALQVVQPSDPDTVLLAVGLALPACIEHLVHVRARGSMK